MNPIRVFLFCCVTLLAAGAFGQGNGKLQIHYMDVNQGDGAILISPNGQTILFDNGVKDDCEKPLAYLRGLGITEIDYMIISHYHADHFGCTTEVLDEFPLKVFSYDRPGAYDSKSFSKYVMAVGNKRKQVSRNTSIVLDRDSENPVRINIAGYNGAGVRTDNENDRSVVAVIHFGDFNAMMAGDLSGFNTTRYKDIETVVARKVGQIEVYKVNHHGSDHSSNPTWLRRLKPRVAIISAGDDNSYGHPTSGTLRRLRDAGVEKTYWTSRGNGGNPSDGTDVIANGSIVVQVVPGADTFTVTYRSQTDTHSMWPAPYNGRR